MSRSQCSLEYVGCEIWGVLARHTPSDEKEDLVDVSIEDQSEGGGIIPGLLDHPIVGFDVKPHSGVRLPANRWDATWLRRHRFGKRIRAFDK